MGETSRAGDYPTGASPYGAMDMSGNVWEWVNDWYNVNYYDVTPPSNPPGLESGWNRVLRGGSWYFNWNLARAAHRNGQYYPGALNYFIGFRCAVSPGE